MGVFLISKYINSDMMNRAFCRFVLDCRISLSVITEFWGNFILWGDIIILRSSAIGVLGLGMPSWMSSQQVTKGQFRKSDFSIMCHFDDPKSNIDSLNSC